jgi:hypothetical protein
VRGIFPWRFDFSVVVMLLVSLYAIWYGLNSVKSPGYLKFLGSTRPHKRVFFSIVLSRFLLLTAAFVLINIILYGFTRARGIEFTAADHIGLLWQLSTTLVILGIFFFLGAFIGRWGHSIMCYLLMFMTWLGLVFAVPVSLGVLAEKIFPDSIEDYQAELDNFKTVVDFEEYCDKIAGPFDRKNIETEKEFAKKYSLIYKNQIQAREGKLKFTIGKNIDTMSKVSLFFPTTFYMNTGNEISSRGYLNYLDFYGYGQEMKHKFVLFYIDRTYYHDPKEMVPFIIGDEDIYTGRSRLPGYFFFGFALNLFYGIFLLWAAYYSNQHHLFPLTKNPGDFSEFNLELTGNTKNSISIRQADILDQLIKFFFGQSTGIPWKLFLDGKNISGGFTGKCICLPDPAEIPVDITGMQLIYLFKRICQLSKQAIDQIVSDLGKELLQKRFKKLEAYEKAKILLGISRFFQPGVYLLKDFSNGIPYEQWHELETRLDTLLEANTIIIDITTNDRYWISSPDTQVIIIQKNGKYLAKYQRITWEISY